MSHVLLADDDESNRALFSLYLERMNVTFVLAEHGQQALELVQTDTFDMILMDLDMPVMDGFEAIQRIRALDYPGPILALTAHAEAAMAERCQAVGANASLIKPVSKEDFMHTVQAHLQHSQAEPMLSSLLQGKDDLKMRKLVKKFVRSLPEKIATIEATVAAEDWVALKALMHQLKGVSGNFGYAEIAALFASMETQLTQASIAVFAPAIADLKAMAVRAEQGVS